MLARFHGLVHRVSHRNLPWPLRAADVSYRHLEQGVNLGQFGTHPCTLSPASVNGPGGRSWTARPQRTQLVTSADVNLAHATDTKITPYTANETSPCSMPDQSIGARNKPSHESQKCVGR